jgi:vancomycin permeability regulator SanA
VATQPLAFVVVGLLLAILLLALPRWALGRRYAAAIYSIADAPVRPVAIVFGAGLRRDGTPMTVLADRVRAAVDLLRRGAVGGILLSGSSWQGDEPEAMRRFAVMLGAPEQALVLDRGGSRTLATCMRAHGAFGIDQAILVTQRYHLPRALVLCRAVGIQAVGVAADLHPYDIRSLVLWKMREVPATAIALWEAYHARHTQPAVTVTPADPEMPPDGP